jgi:uncharacterized protein YndB with AHSA1/START domain
VDTAGTRHAEGSGQGDSTATSNSDTYHMRHRWLIKGPIDDVFDLLSHPVDFPTWWAPCFRSAKSEDRAVTVGAKTHLRVRSRLPYELVWDVTLVEVEPPNLLVTETVVRLSGHFPLRGHVRFALDQVANGVEVLNEQAFVAERHLPRPLRALAQRAFTWNHAWAMKIGGRGLQKAVDSRALGVPANDDRPAQTR